jgi:hypothetical protein
MLGKLRQSLAILLPLLALGGCGSSDEFTADVAGNFTIAVTNGTSSCPFPNWKEGDEASGIGFVITQDGQKAHGTVDGLVGGFVALGLGSAEFDGTIKGNSLTLTNYGQRPQQQGNCSFTYNAAVEGSQTGDTIEGTITYSTKTNGNPDCSAVECSATQRFSGSRPPK